MSDIVECAVNIKLSWSGDVPHIGSINVTATALRTLRPTSDSVGAGDDWSGAGAIGVKDYR